MGVIGFCVDVVKYMINYYINVVFDSNIKNGVYVFGEIIIIGGVGFSEYDNFFVFYLLVIGYLVYDFLFFV